MHKPDDTAKFRNALMRAGFTASGKIIDDVRKSSHYLKFVNGNEFANSSSRRQSKLFNELTNEFGDRFERIEAHNVDNVDSSWHIIVTLTS